MAHRICARSNNVFLQIEGHRCGQIFAFGVRDFTAVENGDHFSLANGISQSFAHLCDRAFYPAGHTGNTAGIKGDRTRHGEPPRKNVLLDRGNLDLLRIDPLGRHVNRALWRLSASPLLSESVNTSFAGAGSVGVEVFFASRGRAVQANTVRAVGDTCDTTPPSGDPYDQSGHDGENWPHLKPLFSRRAPADEH